MSRPQLALVTFLILIASPWTLSGCGDDVPRTSSNDSIRDGSEPIDPAPAPSPAPSPDPAPAPDPAPDEDIARAIHKEVLRLTNEYRSSQGVAALAWNERLYQAAQKHAEDMARLSYFSHTSADGRSAGERISDEGYDWRTWGENIAYGYKTAQAVVNAWINSPGHRANMVNSKFKELGVGYAVRSPSGTAYWVQDFGAQ